MNKKTLNKTIFKSFKETKGRFLSIMLLMMLGSMTLIALKVTGKDIDKTANRYYENHNLFDLSVISDYGITDKDKKELSTLSDKADMEFAYFADVKSNDKSFRIFSNPDTINKFELVEGNLPQKDDEISLSNNYNGKYKLQDTIEFEENDADNKILKNTKYKIVGFVNSTQIISNIAMGSSTSGSGNLEGYAVVNKSNFDSEVYTVFYARYHDLRKFNYAQDEYTKILAKHREELEEMLSDNPQARVDEIKSKASDKIKSANEKIKEAEKKISDSEKKLSDAQKKIDTEKSNLTEKQRELDSNKKKLSQTSNQLSQKESELKAAKKRLDDADRKLSDAEKKINAQKPVIEENRKKLLSTKSVLENTEEKLNQTKSQIDLQKSKLQKAKSNLELKREELIQAGQNPDTSQEIIDLQGQIQSLNQMISQMQAEYSKGFGQYKESLAKYNAGYEKIRQYDDARKSLQQKRADYQTSYSQYKTGLAKLNDGKSQYQNALGKIKSAQSQITDGFSKLESSQKKLDEQVSKFNSEKSKAQDKIDDSKSKIHDAQLELEGITTPKYSVYTRRTMPGGDGIKNVQSISEGISKVSNLFPVVLYLVAALVTITTMTRFVSEERNNAGILKALGYEDTDVIKKFAIYGFASAASGTLLGIVLGNYFLPYILCTSLLKKMQLPKIQYLLYPKTIVLALLSSAICSVLPAVYISVKELKEQASQLLLDKAPVKGSKIFMERIKPLWSRMTFTQKVTARNIFRYKKRMAMTIFGVAGSVALLFAGLGIVSSLDAVQKEQYGQIIKYDAMLLKKDYITEKDQKKMNDLLQSEEISGKLPVRIDNVEKNIPGLNDEQRITMLTTKSDTFSPYINLTQNDAKIKLSDESAVISKKLANLLQVKPNDTFEIKLSNSKSATIKVGAVTKMYAGHFIFMNDKYYEKILNENYNSNSYLLTLKDNSTDNTKKVLSQFMKLNATKAVKQNADVINQVKVITNSLAKVMTVLTVMSFLLAIVILYNLTNINVLERIRELSTIKVLGFTDKEVTMYIYRETICLSIVGIILGILSGKVLHKLILEITAPSEIIFTTKVELWVYIVPILSIIIILYILEKIVNHFLKQIDMLEALKSVD